MAGAHDAGFALSCPAFIQGPKLSPEARCSAQVAAFGDVLVCLEWPALTPALTEIRLFALLALAVGPVAPTQFPALDCSSDLAASCLFNPRREAHFLLE